MEECNKLGLNLEQDFSGELAKLSEFYFDARYPDQIPVKEIDKPLAEKLLRSAEKIGEAVKTKLV